MDILIGLYIGFGIPYIVGNVIHLSIRVSEYNDDKRYHRHAKLIARRAHIVMIAFWLLLLAPVWPVVALAALIYYPSILFRHVKKFIRQVNADRRGGKE